MENRRECLTLYNVATAFGQRPSAIIGVTDNYTAYQFDVAVMLVGRTCERLARDDNGDLEIYLDGETVSKYQSPPVQNLPKVNINAMGTW